MLVACSHAATATLASIRSCGPSLLVGTAERPDGLVADRRVGRDDEEAVLVCQVVVRQWLYVQPGAVRSHFHFTRLARWQGVGYIS
jgi:hypothetical protein